MFCSPVSRAALASLLLLPLAIPAAAADGQSGFSAVGTRAAAAAARPACGNDKEGPDEVCDGPDLGGLSCASLGQGSGTLRCAPDCQSFDFSGCTGPAFCGNGRVDPGEACDAAGPSQVCDWDCTFQACGDLVINQAAGEQCEDGNQSNGDGCSAFCRLEVCSPSN